MSSAHKPEKTTHKSHPKKDNQVKMAVVLVILALVGLLIVLQANNNDSSKEPGGSTDTKVSQSGNAKLYLKPSNQNVAVGSSTTFEVWVDTGGQGVNAVQANLSYPTESFDFGSIDTKGSAFEIQAESSGGNGTVKIGRGHIGDVKGAALIAKVTLTSKAAASAAEVKFAEGSAVVRTSDHTDILKSKTGGAFKISLGNGRVALVRLS